MHSILIVDDDGMVRRALRVCLETAGHVITEATNGIEGLAKTTECNPDLVITDIMMPDMDGCEFIIELSKVRPDIRVIASSGALPSTRDPLYQGVVDMIGVDNFFWKPVVPEQLLDAIARQLRSA